jgi:uncharacterized protein YodC (DUF2158 family)
MQATTLADSVIFLNCSWEEGVGVPTATWTDDQLITLNFTQEKKG